MCPRPIPDLFSNDGDEGRWRNWRSAARSVERKIRELGRNIQMLRNEAGSVSSELTLLERKISDLTAVISERKLRSQAMEHQVHLQDVFKEELDVEMQDLEVTTGQNLSELESEQQQLAAGPANSSACSAPVGPKVLP